MVGGVRAVTGNKRESGFLVDGRERRRRGEIESDDDERRQDLAVYTCMHTCFQTPKMTSVVHMCTDLYISSFYRHIKQHTSKRS